jgi:hypothetical protein
LNLAAPCANSTGRSMDRRPERRAHDNDYPARRSRLSALRRQSRKAGAKARADDRLARVERPSPIARFGGTVACDAGVS